MTAEPISYDPRAIKSSIDLCPDWCTFDHRRAPEVEGEISLGVYASAIQHQMSVSEMWVVATTEPFDAPPTTQVDASIDVRLQGWREHGRGGTGGRGRLGDHIAVTVSTLPLSAAGGAVNLDMTGGEVRSLAAALIRAADVLEEIA